MERHQLKRIMIIILATFNGFLGLYLIRQRVEARAAAYRAEEHLLELFAADGVKISPEAIPHGGPPPVVVLTPDDDEQARAAVFLLGDGAQYAGRARRYVAGNGVVRFHSDGSFTATDLSRRVDPEAFCRDFCRNWSYAIDGPDTPGDGEILLTARYGSLSVHNCGVSLYFEGGVLREAFGTLIPQTGTPGETPKLSAVGALAIFQAKRRENRVVSAEIRRVSLCYALQTSDTEEQTLVPMWRIETDTIPYYVNCVTGALIFST